MKKNIAQRNTNQKPKQAVARVRYLRMAPRKVRLIGNLIKKMGVNEAEAHLITHARRPSQPLLKLLRSAVENAKTKGMDLTKTIIWEVRTDKGPMLKRMIARAQGRGTPIHKDTSHVLMILQETETMLSSKFVAYRAEKKPKTHTPEGSLEESKKEKTKESKERPAVERGNTKKEQIAPEKGFTQKVFRRKSV